jgi:hypothetical protein
MATTLRMSMETIDHEDGTREIVKITRSDGTVIEGEALKAWLERAKEEAASWATSTERAQ